MMSKCWLARSWSQPTFVTKVTFNSGLFALFIIHSMFIKIILVVARNAMQLQQTAHWSSWVETPREVGHLRKVRSASVPVLQILCHLFFLERWTASKYSEYLERWLASPVGPRLIPCWPHDNAWSTNKIFHQIFLNIFFSFKYSISKTIIYLSLKT